MASDQIEIYVRSSPLGRIGIHWRKASGGDQVGQRTETPDALMEQIVPDPDDGSKLSVNSVINTVKPCLILAKYNGKIFLEVTGIDATPERSAKLGRRISEVVLWVGDPSPEIETKLRKLAYCALLGLWKPESEFRTKISSSIEFDGLNDYKVNAEELMNIYHNPEQYSPEGFFLPSIDSEEELSKSWLVDDEVERIEAIEGIIQLANRLCQASFDNLESAIAIAEVKQNEDKTFLNYRTYTIEVPKVVEPIIPPIPPVNEPPTPPHEPTSPLDGKKKLLVAILGLLLILLIIILGPLKNTVLNILPSQPTSQPIPTLMEGN